MLLKLTISLLILVGTLPIARADDASKLAKAHEIFQITNASALVDQTRKLMMAQAYANIKKLFPQTNMTAEQQAQLNQFYEKMNAIVANTVSWDKLEPLYAKAYADTFTEQQLDDLIAFYKSPTGKAMIEKMPGLQKQLAQIGNQMAAAAIPKIRQALEDFEKQCKPQQKAMSPKAVDKK